jgi:hypothetical protein
MAADYRDLTKDETFWKTEKEITKYAFEHINQLATIKAFDFFKLSPENYNVKEEDTKDKDGQPKTDKAGKEGAKKEGGGKSAKKPIADD